MTIAAGADRPQLTLRDAIVAATYALIMVLLTFSGVNSTGVLGETVQLPLGVSIVAMLVGAASLALRRRCPVVPLAVAGPLGLLEIAAGGQLAGYLLLFEALFEPVMHGSRALARRTTVLAGVLTAAVFIAAMVLLGEGPHLLAIMLTAALVVLTPLLWGWEVRHHRDARRSAEDLAAAEHELAATRAAHAVETERRTIAHDLHDVIAGHLSAVSLHTSLAETLEDEDARRRSLATARDSARAALRDLRSMIGVLSAQEEGSLPSATLDWPSLTARLRGRDPAAHVEIDPAVTDPARVEPSVQAALLRIAAEAVTNAARHGSAPIHLRAQLETDVEGAEVLFELTNRVAGAPTPPSALDTGVGRRAIAHRATAVGGTAVSAPTPDGAAWHVQARLPAQPPQRSPLAAPSADQEISP